MKDDFGWGGDHVGKLVALRTMMKHLNGNAKIGDKLEAATFTLMTYHENAFPESLRPAFNRIVEARTALRREITKEYVVFAFDELTPTKRKQLVADLTALYEACLIDIGRSWPEWDFVYPKGDVLPKPVRRRKTRKS